MWPKASAGGIFEPISGIGLRGPHLRTRIHAPYDPVTIVRRNVPDLDSNPGDDYLRASRSISFRSQFRRYMRPPESFASCSSICAVATGNGIVCGTRRGRPRRDEPSGYGGEDPTGVWLCSIER
jgi:hypothetical protein